MDDTATTKRARVLRDFTDAGTERRFTAGAEIDLPEGELANYRAAGLVEVIESAPAPAAADTGGEVDDTKKPGRRG